MAAINTVKLDLDLSGLKNLQSLAKRRSVAKKAVTKMARTVQPTVRAMAPKRQEGGGGTLKASIGTKNGVSKKSETGVYAVVGARKKIVRQVTFPGRKKPTTVIPANYLHLVAFGTRPHALGKDARLARKNTNQVDKLQDTGRKHPGAKANNFVARAWAARKGEAEAAGLETFRVEYQRAIAAEHKRLMAKMRGKK